MGSGTLVIFSELGTGSTEIAEIVGKKLGMKVYNTDKLLRNVAATSNLTFEQLATSSVSGEVEIDQLLFAHALDVLERGNVILEGRSSFLVTLAPITLKVFLVAPEHMRAKHVAGLRGLSYDKAFEEIRASDQDRENLARKICRVDWKDPSMYDLIINTGGLKDEDVAELIMAGYAKRLGG